MKKIIVTGCKGQLGRAVNEIYSENNEYELINTDMDELDITDVHKVIGFVTDCEPYAIINCAAYTSVDLCEVNIDDAYRINAVGPRNLAIAADKCSAKLVHISTDYVFQGTGKRPYTEFDSPLPVSMYGKSKLEGELFVKELCRKFFIIRTAWLYGDGNNFVKTMLRLSENHSEVSVVSDQYGSPTSAAELAKAVKYLIETENYGTFHGTCEGMCSWAEFADEIFRLAGRNTRVNYITSGEYKQMNPAAAERPKYSVLENYMLKLTTDYNFADWKTAIAEYLK